MKRDNSRTICTHNAGKLAALLCTLLVACDGSVRLCGEYACLFYQNDNQNINQHNDLSDSQTHCDNTLFFDSTCHVQPRQCEAAGSIRDRAPDILNQLRNANRSCSSAAALNPTSPAQALVWDERLAQASAGHARDMATNGFVSFIGSDGLSTADRVQLAGFSANIITESIDSGPQTTAEVINIWLDIQTDCSQMLDPRTRRIGMACAVPDSATSGPYWSLLLGAPTQ